MTTTIELSDNEAALILSIESNDLQIQAHFPDRVLELAAPYDGDIFALDGGPLVFPSHVIMLLAILLEHDAEFPKYVYDRVVEVQGEDAVEVVEVVDAEGVDAEVVEVQGEAEEKTNGKGIISLSDYLGNI